MIVNTSKEQAFVTGTENNGQAFKTSESEFKQASSGYILGALLQQGSFAKENLCYFPGRKEQNQTKSTANCDADPSRTQNRPSRKGNQVEEQSPLPLFKLELHKMLLNGTKILRTEFQLFVYHF